MPRNSRIWWQKGWERKYHTLDNENNTYVARVYSRLLSAVHRCKTHIPK
jgi:hypothetical protein